MKYIVLDLKPDIRICTKDGESIIFETKQDAFRYSDKREQGLVYPIIDIMKIFDQIKALSKKYITESTDDYTILDELLALTDEIV